MLTVRNQTMVERLSAYIRQEQTFIAVGAAHLPGEDGMVNFCSRKDYRNTGKSNVQWHGSPVRGKNRERELVHLVSKENAYAIDMPSEPFPLDLGQ
jgi:hypothetical protein